MTYQGVFWEKGTMEGCYILFPKGYKHSFCVGTEESDSPTFLIKSDRYIYLCVKSGDDCGPNGYYVIEGDFDSPFVYRQSGYVIDFGTERFLLL